MNDETRINESIVDEFMRAMYADTIDFERKIATIVPTIFAIVILVGLIGNLLVVIVGFNRQMRNSTNTLIIGKCLIGGLRYIPL